MPILNDISSINIKKNYISDVRIFQISRRHIVFIQQLICHAKTPLASLQMELTWFKPAFMRQRILTQIKDALSSGSFSKYHGIHNQAHFTHLLPSFCGEHPHFLIPSHLCICIKREAQLASIRFSSGESAILPKCAAFVNTVPCLYPHIAKKLHLKWAQFCQYIWPLVFLPGDLCVSWVGAVMA